MRAVNYISHLNGYYGNFLMMIKFLPHIAVYTWLFLNYGTRNIFRKRSWSIANRYCLWPKYVPGLLTKNYFGI